MFAFEMLKLGIFGIFASIESYIFFFLTEGLANGLLKDEMVLQGSDGTNASVYSGGLAVDNTF